MTAPGRTRLPFILVMVTSAALLAAPWWGHIDDLDAQLYRVVVRRMLQDGTWFDLRFVPGTLSPFREHLPFGFWPSALAARLLGDWAIDGVAALFSLAALAVVLRSGHVLGGTACGVAAGLVLATTEAFWHYGARILLEPFLFFFATAAAVLALAPEVRPRRWLAAGALAGLAACVKGPFGLAPLACVAAARVLVLRRPKELAWAAVAFAVALAPAALFLLWDRQALHLGYWEGYVQKQLLASASGARTDGSNLWWLPFRVFLFRFWPGLPLVLAALALHFRDPDSARRQGARILLLANLLLLVALCLPSRKWSNHTYVAFPLLSLAAGYGASRALAPLLGKPVWEKRALVGLSAVALACVVFAVSGLGRHVQLAPCPLGAGLAAPLKALPAGDVLVVSEAKDVALLAQIADETGRDARVVPALGPDAPRAIAALVPESAPAVPRWRRVTTARGWSLLAWESGPAISSQ